MLSAHSRFGTSGFKPKPVVRRKSFLPPEHRYLVTRLRIRWEWPRFRGFELQNTFLTSFFQQLQFLQVSTGLKIRGIHAERFIKMDTRFVKLTH